MLGSVQEGFDTSATNQQTKVVLRLIVNRQLFTHLEFSVISHLENDQSFFQAQFVTLLEFSVISQMENYQNFFQAQFVTHLEDLIKSVREAGKKSKWDPFQSIQWLKNTLDIKYLFTYLNNENVQYFIFKYFRFREKLAQAEQAKEAVMQVWLRFIIMSTTTTLMSTEATTTTAYTTPLIDDSANNKKVNSDKCAV